MSLLPRRLTRPFDASGPAAVRILDPLLATVFPSRCPACGAGIDHPTSGPLCRPCWDGLPTYAATPCVCGAPLASGIEGPCGRCRRGLSPMSRGASLGPHEGPLKALLHELKYRGHRGAAARVAERWATSAAVCALLETPCVLVPIPLHPLRRRERGFNQSELLARQLGRRVPNVSVEVDVLVRRRDTRSQTGLSARDRRRNVRGAFAVRHRSRIAGRRVMLIDDVSTTGATARACATVLLDAGAAEVGLLTASRAP